MNRVLMKVVLSIAVSFLLVSCPAPVPGGQQGSLSVAINSSAVPNRSILPDTDMNPASYTVTGAGPGGASFKVEMTGLSATADHLAFGSWTVAVEAENADGIVIGRGVGIMDVGEDNGPGILDE